MYKYTPLEIQQTQGLNFRFNIKKIIKKHKKLLIIVIIVVIIIVGLIVGLYFGIIKRPSPPPPPSAWKCNEDIWACVQDPLGPYISKDKCQKSCIEPQPSAWKCNEDIWACVQDPLGPYISKDKCQKSCIEPQPSAWKCNEDIWACVQDPLGPYISKDKCQKSCIEPQPSAWKCNEDIWACVQDPLGPYISKDRCQESCIEPQPSAWKCNEDIWACVQDPLGPYISKDRCQESCIEPQPSAWKCNEDIWACVKDPLGPYISKDRCQESCIKPPSLLDFNMYKNNVPGIKFYLQYTNIANNPKQSYQNSYFPYTDNPSVLTNNLPNNFVLNVKSKNCQDQGESGCRARAEINGAELTVHEIIKYKYTAILTVTHFNPATSLPRIYQWYNSIAIFQLRRICEVRWTTSTKIKGCSILSPAIEITWSGQIITHIGPTVKLALQQQFTINIYFIGYQFCVDVIFSDNTTEGGPTNMYISPDDKTTYYFKAGNYLQMNGIYNSKTANVSSTIKYSQMQLIK